jgi:cell division protein FtsZ
MKSILALAVALGSAHGAALMPNARTPRPMRRAAVTQMQDEIDAGAAAVAPPPEPELRRAPQAPGLSPCSIKVIGVGGGGGNTLNRMVEEGPGVERSTFLEYVAANTDVQALSASLADTTIQLGRNAARGLGAGGVPSVGRASAIDAAGDIETLVSGVDMVFVTAGMGGGTGSGAAPVVAELAKAADCLTVGIVTKPFSFEGRRRMQQALEAIEELQNHVDILIVVSNDKLLEIVPEGLPLQEAFGMADEILRQGITGISDIVVKPGLINVDFADVRSVMQNAGPALMGIGRGFGKTRARDAALAAVSSPLLDFPIERAKGVVFTITGNSDMSLQEVNDVAGVISSIVADDANIIFGTSVDESFADEICVTVVATSFEVPDVASANQRRAVAPPPMEPAQWAVPPSQQPPKRSFWSRF